MDSSIRREENELLYFFQGCACIAVILLHAPFPGKIGAVFKALATFAVPFFFMVSGYYFYLGNLEEELERDRKKIGQILKLLVCVYIPTHETHLHGHLEPL